MQAPTRYVVTSLGEIDPNTNAPTVIVEGFGVLAAPDSPAPGVFVIIWDNGTIQTYIDQGTGAISGAQTGYPSYQFTSMGG
jgi:hypothetical protein